MTEVPSSRDVIIIGGGPSGAAAGAELAEHGHRVVILEREKFPRYHVGESLVPFAYEPLERLGLIPSMRASGFRRKHSITFIPPSGGQAQPFDFRSRYESGTLASSWQVRRADFDEMLLRNAALKGAEVREQCTVTGLIRDAHGVVTGVRLQTGDGTVEEISAPVTIDATGREAFSSLKLGWRVSDTELHRVAVWSYFKGGTRHCGPDEGATTVAVLPAHGWFWHIPMQDDMVSVGVVAEGKYLTRDGCRDPELMLRREIESNPWIEKSLAGSRHVGVPRITADFSRHARFGAAPGLLMTGDAFAFMDPVFSTGLTLALKSGVMAGDAVHEALAGGDCSPGRFSAYTGGMRRNVENLRRLIHAFYTPGFSFQAFTDRFPEAAGAVMDCLAGDLDRDFSGLWSCLGQFVEFPEPLPYGVPFIPRSA
ncbi:MAG: NAD(P)/FAD-dependent oxidoreductase [Verrucomicrobiaceae bacterium]|nr:MAG: NAD(P)/FAD-dependent oxidoreductase [Verrucomicrobiaceae bacterium]